MSLSAFALFLGGLCWVISLWLPAFYTNTNIVMGYWVLVSGWLGVVLFQFAWFANLLVLGAVLWMYRYPIRATLLSASAVLIASQTFWFTVMPGKYENVYVVEMGLGFWLWFIAMILLCIGVIFGSDDASVQDDEQDATAYMHRQTEPSSRAALVAVERLKQLKGTETADPFALQPQQSTTKENLPNPIIPSVAGDGGLISLDDAEPALADLAELKQPVIHFKPKGKPLPPERNN